MRTSLAALALVIALVITPVVIAPIASADTAALVVTLSRTVCFGACPVYKVSLFDDGRVVYEGEQYVKVKGRKTKKVDRAVVARVKQAIADSGIQRLDVHCCDCLEWTDQPSVLVGVHADGAWKTIVDYHGCTKTPAAVRTLEETIDALLGTSAFVGASANVP